MYPFSLTTLATVLAVASSVQAHMMMKTPVPYGKSTLNNSPLAGDGSDFPCKQRGETTYKAEGASNVMAVGSTQSLSFTGSAVHGGGSCQVSLTQGNAPDKNSKWMVIKSIEGGCPADVAGNLPADPNGNGAATFQYTIPEGIAPGEYTIAWTWVNKIGNREYYMNCGPATITGAKKKRYAPTPKQSPNKRQANFPEMFVANLAGVSNGCTTTEGVDIAFPNPGDDVTKSSNGAFGAPVGCSGGSGQVAAGSGGDSSSSSAAGAGTGASTVASSANSAATGANTGAVTATGAASVVPTGGATATGFGGGRGTQVGGGQTAQTSASVKPGVFASGAASSGDASATATATATVIPIAGSSTTAATIPSSTGTTAVGAQSGACDQEGEWACSTDGKTFQRCASGQWSPAMAMASGLTCTPGISANINMKVVSIAGGEKKLKARHGFFGKHRRALAGSF